MRGKEPVPLSGGLGPMSKVTALLGGVLSLPTTPRTIRLPSGPLRSRNLSPLLPLSLPWGSQMPKSPASGRLPMLRPPLKERGYTNGPCLGPHGRPEGCSPPACGMD